MLADYVRLLEADSHPAATRLFAERVARVPSALLDALGPQEADPGELSGCRHDLEAMAADSTDLERWSAIDRPLLLLSGEESWEPMPATLQELAKTLPHAQHVVLAGQSHFATHTAPQQFADAVLSHLLSV